jgi:hypothetical protein
MELDHAILADVASPRPDGKLDLHGVGWDTVYAPSVPVTHPRMDLVVRFLLSRHEVEAGHRVVVTLVTADGDELARVDAEVAPMSAEERDTIPAGRRVGIGLLLSLASVTFPEYGIYNLAITWDGTEVREPMRLFVERVPEQQPD